MMLASEDWNRKEMEEWRRVRIKRVHGVRSVVVRAGIQNVVCGTRAKKLAQYV
jgi:hypothetical protein